MIDYSSMSDEKKILLDNAIKLCRRHRISCDGVDCDISLYYIFMLLDLARIPITYADFTDAHDPKGS